MSTSQAPKGKILVVDDDRDIVDTLCDILELRGWQTLRAYDGLEAVNIVSRQAVDWIVMDVRMPRLTGIEALQAIRGVLPNARIVLMTAYASRDITVRAEREGVAKVLFKPFEPTALFSVIERAA
jgi:CheY-like chemotaxis protein